MNAMRFECVLDEVLRQAATTLTLARDIEAALVQAAAATASERPWRCNP